MKPICPRRSINVTCENNDCVGQQSLSFTPTEFEDFLEEGEFNCDSCGNEMSVDGHQIECYICEVEFDDYSLSQISLLLDERCESCAGRPEWDADFYSIRIAGSWSSEYDIYDWSASGKQASVLERKGRTDYWEGLVHFCSAEEFISIYRDRRIRCSSTGLYNKKHADKSKAVCLTEATIPNWDELKVAHGEYGFIFRKKDVIRLDGAPAIYLPQTIIDGMKSRNEQVPETLWPYLTKLQLPTAASKQMQDYLHEREWRVPRDIDFESVTPYAVTFAKRRPNVEDQELILEAAREFQELTI